MAGLPAVRDALRAGLLAVLLVLALTMGAAAQDEGLDYENWESTALRAEQVLTAGEASTPSLESLRGQLVDWRNAFLDARNTNQARIETLQSQLEALGPPPEEASSESEEIAARRTDLDKQLSQLTAPVLRAEEAYNRANGLINEIDRIIRTRETDRLMTLGPSPLNPVYWPAMAEGLLQAPLSVQSEIRDAWTSDVKRKELWQNLPRVLLLLALGLLLLWRGPGWIDRLGAWLRRRTRHGTGVWSVLSSVGLILLPLAGLYAIVSGVVASEMMGQRGETLLQLVPALGLIILGARWLCIHAISREGGAGEYLSLSQPVRNEAHWYGVALGVVVALRALAERIGEMENLEDGGMAALAFPFLVLAGLALFRIGQILTGAGETTPSEEGEPQFRHGVMRIIGRLGMIVAVVGPLLGAVGYMEAGARLVYPAALTLALMGFVTILQRFANDIYRLITGRVDDDADGLIPVLVGFLLAVAAMPMLALIWGTRTAQLHDLWARFREGFVIGETRLSPTDFLVFVVVFVLGYAATRLVQGTLRSSVLPRTRIDPGGQTAIISGIGYVGIALAALIAITSAGIDLTALGYVAGALSVGIGFGLQNVVSNFVSGIILLIERPISEGDWIEVGGNMGYVRDISVRSTRIETFDRTDVIVPNADFVSGTVTNYTRGNTVGRAIVPVGVAYGTDTRRVEKILQEIAEDHPMVLHNPPPAVIFQGFGASSLDFEIRAILRDVNWVLNVKSEMNHAIAKRFVEEGIEIPFPQQDVWFRNPDTMRGRDQSAPADLPKPEAGDQVPAGTPSGPLRPDADDVELDTDADK